jgi:multiple sugar transport system ATP-binding protein
VAEVRLTSVTKQYEGAERPSLFPLDLTIPDGEMVVLVGPSGCGKSTTLRIIAGLEDPTTGQVFIGERDVTRVPAADRDVAMVFQSYALYPHMTVFENLAFSLRMRKVSRAEVERRVGEAARSLAIEPYLDRLPRQLSGGQRQRVAIGRAVVRDPRVFLFDEPLSNLDAQLRAEMRREIARIRSRAKSTAVYVTHDQTEAMTLADRIVVMKDGIVQQMGTPLELYDAPSNLFVAGFLGSPAMNFLRGRLHNGALGLRAELTGLSVSLPPSQYAPAKVAVGKDVVLGVRPQDLSLGPRNGRTALPARVEVRELMGSEAFLHLDTPAGLVILRTEAHGAAREGEAIDVFIDAGKVHLFDSGTELRLA